jgi:hypothetical protein
MGRLPSMEKQLEAHVNLLIVARPPGVVNALRTVGRFQDCTVKDHTTDELALNPDTHEPLHRAWRPL